MCLLKGNENIHYWTVPTFFACLFGFIIVSAFFSVYEVFAILISSSNLLCQTWSRIPIFMKMQPVPSLFNLCQVVLSNLQVGVETLFICFLEDEKNFGGSFMSENMKNVMIPDSIKVETKI